MTPMRARARAGMGRELVDVLVVDFVSHAGAMVAVAVLLGEARGNVRMYPIGDIQFCPDDLPVITRPAG